jgi:predicted nuclease of predicted toxin-antitoxin system
MNVPLYMDVNVRAEITRQLRVRKVDVLTSQEDGTRESSDSDLLDRATFLGRVLFTRDVDLLPEATKRQRKGRSFVGVIYAPQIGVTIGECVAELELIAKTEESSKWVNRVEYLPLK